MGKYIIWIFVLIFAGQDIKAQSTIQSHVEFFGRGILPAICLEVGLSDSVPAWRLSFSGSGFKKRGYEYSDVPDEQVVKGSSEDYTQFSTTLIHVKNLKDRLNFEIGAGISYLGGDWNVAGGGSGTFGHLVLGIRSEPLKEGLVFRLSFNPVFGNISDTGSGLEIWPFYGGFSFGYRFK